MIKLIPVSNSLDLNDHLRQIYFDAFPTDERREWQDLKELLNHPDFKLYQIFNDQEIIGLITYWNLPGCVFIEHFAIEEPMRGKGIGTLILKQVIEKESMKVILEVEEPITLPARRRIAFYSRLGFRICESIYYQPPYHTYRNKVRMQLMSYPVLLDSDDFEEIKGLIHKIVYHHFE